MGITSLRSLLLAAIVLSNCITWTASRHHYRHNVNGHRSRHRRQGANLFLPGSYVIPGGEGSGPWGEWQEVSPCSRTCGGGVASQKRICLTVGSDGPPCKGGDTKYFSCHTQDCPEGSGDFRAEQCAEYNDVLFRDNNKYSWVPYTKAPNPCELNCMPRGERFYYRHRSKVVDGTRCNDESFDVCVDGVCQAVGCDMMLGSNAREDKCRECRGNGTNCQTIEGIIDNIDLRRGYNDVLLIPQGATSIIIEEIKESSNYLALRAKEHTKYYLNGNYQIDFPRSLVIAGSLWHYERSQQGFAAPDKLRCVGPTNEPLYLSLLLQGENVGVKYEYSIPSDIVPRPALRYDWVFDKFTPCSASCGGGFQMRKVTCRSRDELEEVDESLCDEGLKPATNQTCNTQPCEPRWVEGPWSPCSKPCGEGGTRSRKVHCEKIMTNGLTFRFSTVVSDKECFDLLGAKPKLYEECNQNASCPTWFTGPWKPCDKLCGEGKQTRQVVCHTKVKGKVEVFDDNECSDKKPPSEQPCNLHPCGGIDWVLSDWSGCDTCLSTTRTRMAKCATADRQVVNTELCSYHPIPSVEEPCVKSKLPACEFQWYATQWSNCSVECGKGVRTRQVFCGMFDGKSVTKVDDDKCNPEEKYRDSKPCEVPKEKCTAKWFTGPWTECNKKCGGGEQSRQVMCLIGEETGKCEQNTMPDTLQSCNMGPCNEDEMIPVDSKSTPIMDDYYEDYEDCDEEAYDEVGAEADSDTMENEQMFSDSPYDNLEDFTFILITPIEDGSGEGSGDSNWTTTWETTESTFSDTSTTESYESDGTSGTASYITETTETGTMETLSSKTSDETITTDGTESTETDATSVTEISSTEPTKTYGTETSDTGSTESSTTETTELISTQESSEAPTTRSTELDSTETVTTGSESTDTDDTTSTETSSTEPSETSTQSTDLGSTETVSTGSESADTDGTTSTESSSTESADVNTKSTELGSTETVTTGSESTDTDGTTSTESSSTEPIDTSTTETLDTSTTESSTTSDESTISSTAQYTSDSTTELSTETSRTSEITESTSTTDSSSSEISSEKETSTTESMSESTSESTTESTVINTSSASTESSASEGSTEESTASESEASSVITEGTTELSTTAESTTEVVSTTTAETEITSTTESISTETTESILSSSTQEATSSETVSESTQESTEPTDTTESTTSTESSISESVGTTESSSTEGTDTTFTGLSTTEMSSEGTTLGFSTSQSWASTIEGIAKKPKCKRKKIAKCLRSKYGCCPDHRTPADGPFDKGCPTPKTCKETKFGCCDDGVSPAAGPNGKGCPVVNCNETLYGCCLSDKTTPAEGNDQEGCPKPVPACEKSKYGCCKDGKTTAKGLKKQGCPETETQKPDTKPKGCEASKFGCCADNTTEATGPDGAGCPCNITKFGCCPDGVSPAGGAQMEGCLMSCNTTEYGCCQDGQTPAHGPDFQGCCLLTAFGCCPDNYKAAEGPHLEGCGCKYARYGCCPDNKTIARGPNNEGCDCKYSQYGCCPDRHTPAKGPNFKGCDCNTHQFGCCPDGYTAAMGPNLQGCYCQQTEFGCCGDEKTAAQGPNQFGCDCASSKFGCCPDGVTEAKGPKFLNCTDVPENRQAACSLATDRGQCRNYTVLWYYDMTYGGCSRFWYGGCGGNGNRFNSREECEDICVQPAPKDACKLPKVRGSCTDRQYRWYYDSIREQCSQFEYSGCLGNANKFESRELCQKQCEPDTTEDQCNLPIERGSCAGNFGRWGFNPESGGCEQFIWGGCEGNSNRFSSEAACLQRCNPPGVQKPECSLPQESGNCTEKLPLWSFNVMENRCLPFYYTGCGGNDNRFDSEATCSELCPSSYVQETCAMPAVTGNCANFTLRWYFDTRESGCRQFYYGGCGGNKNNFMTEEQCRSSCVEQQLTTTKAPVDRKPEDKLPDFCFLETERGPCTNYETRWAYDSIQGDCIPFEYGGCGGNRNNFHEQKTCQYYCTSAQDTCQLPVLRGPCGNFTLLWFYDTATDICQQFYYGGCEGNDNRFESQEACERRCRKQVVTTPPAVTATTSTTITTTTVAAPQGRSIPPGCQLVSPSLEECVQPGQVWYLDVNQGVCVAHENAPSGTSCRRRGTYVSQEACERACGAFAGINVCRYPVEPGPCNDVLPKFYYDETTGRCEQFTYGGCHGGPNRFSTVEECEQVCKPETDPCKQHAETGNCLEYYIMWYYDELRDDCGQFVYTGCSGNDNRFETREACINRCMNRDTTTTIRAINTTTVSTTTTPPPEPASGEECRTPVSLDPCEGNVTTYYYDTRTGACVHGDFGGCGYANSYRSEEECERQCGAFRGLGVEVCRAPLDPGPCLFSEPKVYWDASTGRCQPFAYGGCQGGPNRFSSEEECQEVCGGIGPEAACLEEVDSGYLGCGEPGPRFRYDTTTADCHSFVFFGCGGNKNNFPSYGDCVQRCVAGSAGSPDNSIQPECDRFNEECARLRCNYQIQRVQTEYGCERCVCAPAPVDCEPFRLECQNLRCRNIEKTLDANRCERCRCADDPCTYVNCSAGERCITTQYKNPAISDSEYLTECRPVNKSGFCPEVLDGEDMRGECQRHCYDDADCVGSGKCCEIGCHVLCLNPAATTTTTTPQPTTTFQPVNVDNEIQPICERFTEECGRLQCNYQMQRVQTEYGCERCLCVAAPADCEPYRIECQNMQCSNIHRAVDHEGCERCRCLDDPCDGLICLAGERCEATSYRNPYSGEFGYLTECRAVNKSGWCPDAAEVDEARGGRCDRECNDDANCLGSSKCCPHSCGSICLSPATTTTTTPRPTTTYRLDVPRAPIANIDTEEEVSVGEGGKATLRCLFHGNPPPSITWRRGELTIESDIDRYRLLSDGALEIVSIYRNDSGVYICIANNALGTATQEVRLQVNDPEEGSAGIAGVPNAVVTGEMGRPLNIRCLAYGFPPPSIYWYRGRNGTMVPYSSALYEARGNILQIRSLTYETAGEYLCQAYNGIGKPAEWTVNVQIYRPERNTDYPSYASRGPNIERELTTTSTPAPEIDYPIFSVPVTTRISVDRTKVEAGAEINIPCEVDGYPLPEVYWTKDSVRLVPTSRMILTDARLTISGANTNDSGVYGCHASNSYSSHTSTVQITVEGLYIPAKCTDNPFFANCNLIVRSKFCKHQYYSRFCCKSCVEAGQLNPLELDMQADEAWRKKK